MHGPDWLITRDYPDQDNKVVVVSELTAEINPINPVPPIIDLTRHRKCIKIERIMLKVLQFLKSEIHPFETLVHQEQKLYCNSVYFYLLNPRIKIKVDVKNTIRELNLNLVNNTLRAEGRLIHFELPLDAKTPLFLPYKSKLVDFIVTHIHNTHSHCGVSQTLSLYRQHLWTPKIRCLVKSLLCRIVVCHNVKGKTLSKPLPPMLPSEQVRWKEPFTTVGVDHTGHLWYRDDLSTPSFLLCLRRLAATNGAPSLILSDTH